MPERGIEENYVEALARFREIAQRVALHHLHGAGADALARRFERRKRGAIALDHDYACGATRCGLETQSAAAGKEIQATQTREPLSQPVEERLAHAIGRRSEPWARGNFYAPAAVLAGDDPYLSFVRMH